MTAEAQFAGIEHYDREEVWDPAGSIGNEANRGRAEFIRDQIPAGVRTVLDVGCGSGAVTNLLTERYQATGLDISPVALKHVKAKTVVGSATDLPFEDRSFDALVIAEVLEHLDDDQFERACDEAGRVASGAVIVTVPNRENLRATRVSCPDCGEVFSPYRHYRSFGPRHMRGLVPGFELKRTQTIGPREHRVTTLEAMVRGRLARGAPLPFPAVCPSCGAEGKVPQHGRQGPTFGRYRRFQVHRVLRPIRRARWLFALYERS